MGKFHIFTQILQGNALFSGKIYTAGKIFTHRRSWPMTVATNFKSVTGLCIWKCEKALIRLLVPRYIMIIYYILHIICYKSYIIYNTLYVIALNIIIITLLCIWKCEKALIGLLAPRFNISAIKGTSAVGLGRNFQPFPYLIFVIFFTRVIFLENKIYTKKTRKLRQNTQ